MHTGKLWNTETILCNYALFCNGKDYKISRFTKNWIHGNQDLFIEKKAFIDFVKFAQSINIEDLEK